MPSIVGLDTETTGLTENDRIVSIGMIRLDLGSSENSDESGNSEIDVKFIHFVFDPKRDSHSKAREVHGYDDWTLRHQDKFSDHAEAISSVISGANLLVSHNSAFDVGFIKSEFSKINMNIDIPTTYCTMRKCRELGYPSSLNRAIEKIGLQRTSSRHGALEDAALALNLYFSLNGHAVRLPMEAFQDRPTNFRIPPLKNKREPNRVKYAQRADIWIRFSPLIFVLVSIANADGIIHKQERLSIIKSIGVEAAYHGIDLGSADAESIVDASLGLAPTEADLMQASLYLRDAETRTRLVSYVKELISADGEVSASELDVLRLVNSYIL